MIHYLFSVKQKTIYVKWIAKFLTQILILKSFNKLKNNVDTENLNKIVDDLRKENNEIKNNVEELNKGIYQLLHFPYN